MKFGDFMFTQYDTFHEIKAACMFSTYDHKVLVRTLSAKMYSGG